MAVLVGQLHGSGDVVVPENVELEVVEAFRVALFWARVNEEGEAGTRRREAICLIE